MKLINVRILDHDYQIRSDASGETILQIADYLNSQIEDLQSSSKPGTRSDLAVMTAFKAASDYFQVKEDLEKLRQRIEADSEKLAKRIESNLTGETHRSDR
ncbi:MAG: cell division protein ZapA [Candidatus Adiutricales bacterium]